MKKTAVLIDAGFLRAFLPSTVGFGTLADITEAFALACISADEGEEMHRVLYYDCPPYDGDGRRKPHPLDATRQPTSPGYRNFFNSVLSLLKSKPYFAVRLGEMSFDGWSLSDKATSEILAQGRQIAADDFEPVLRREGVQVVLASLSHNVKASLREHADLYRNVDLQGILSALYPNGLPTRPPSNRVTPASLPPGSQPPTSL